MRILKQEKDGYVPGCGIFVTPPDTENPMVMVELSLPKDAMDWQLDKLRSALKKWAEDCEFGELAELDDEVTE